MGKKKADKNLEKEVINDPAFYNDQIGDNLEPMRANMGKRTEKKRK